MARSGAPAEGLRDPLMEGPKDALRAGIAATIPALQEKGAIGGVPHILFHFCPSYGLSVLTIRLFAFRSLRLPCRLSSPANVET